MVHAATGRHRDWALRTTRTCYDHLVGRLGVALAGALVTQRHIVIGEGGGQVTTKGTRFLSDFGIDLAGAGRRRRAFCRPCLDWSERRPHLAGSIGSALAARCFELGWIEHTQENRALVITDTGRNGFAEEFGIILT